MRFAEGKKRQPEDRPCVWPGGMLGRRRMFGFGIVLAEGSGAKRFDGEGFNMVPGHVGPGYGLGAN